MYWSLGIGIYLLLGAVFAWVIVFYLNEKAEEYENGEEFEQEDIERLEEVSKQANLMGETGYMIFLFIVCTLFWLPMLIFNPPVKN